MTCFPASRWSGAWPTARSRWPRWLSCAAVRLAHSFVILDEAQNTTPVQMKMFLTRMGEGTRMVITGDLSQVDLPPGQRSGLRDALDTLEGVPGIGVNRFDKRDIVRHPLVARIVDAYEQHEAAIGEQRREARRQRDGDNVGEGQAESPRL